MKNPLLALSGTDFRRSCASQAFFSDVENSNRPSRTGTRLRTTFLSGSKVTYSISSTSSLSSPTSDPDIEKLSFPAADQQPSSITITTRTTTLGTPVKALPRHPANSQASCNRTKKRFIIAN
ncbi:MAG: hypothetical protein K2H17_01910 [Duncaniella sp.]|uniref:hypothetical protein n=1 Tax=Duncaniella sp. TaxID=2518496 RepID=UPI0023C4A70A|nr:hypothetical protein [Duncaniella sp.]MDE5988132.1 hypothetical protein [Duncaniella sp.]